MNHKIRAATLAAELRQTRERIAELEAENDRLGTAGMRARDWSRAWKRKAKLLRDDVRKCHGMANEINILVKGGRELEQENAKLRRTLARLEAAATQWILHPGDDVEEGWVATLKELSEAITQAQVVMKTGAEAGGEGEE